MAETVLERIGTEGFETKPSPAQSGRVRSSLLVQQHEDTSPVITENFGEEPNEVKDTEGPEGVHIADMTVTVYYKK